MYLSVLGTVIILFTFISIMAPNLVTVDDAKQLARARIVLFLMGFLLILISTLGNLWNL